MKADKRARTSEMRAERLENEKEGEKNEGWQTEGMNEDNERLRFFKAASKQHRS